MKAWEDNEETRKREEKKSDEWRGREKKKHKVRK